MGMRHKSLPGRVELVEDTAVSRHICERDIDGGAETDGQHATPAQN
jgi:hypothetical protein